ncbi:MAG: sulfite exporter TauE/SafE family protein [Bacteroidota bacterium]
MEITTLIAAFFVGIFASFIGAMVGSAGLITIPFLMFLGLPPHVAIATHKVGAVGLLMGAISKFWKTDLIQWKVTGLLVFVSAVSALIGAQILVYIDKDLLSNIVVVLLLVVLPILFLKKEVGTVQKSVSSTQQGIGYFLYFLAQIFGAFFGGGAATFLIYILMTFFGFTILQANATSMLPSLVLNSIALVIFGTNGIIEFEMGIVLFLGMMLGGRLGALMAVKKGNSWVKIVFVGVVIVLVIKIITQ